MYIGFGADGMEIVTSSKHKMFPGYGSFHTQNVWSDDQKKDITEENDDKGDINYETNEKDQEKVLKGLIHVS